MNKKNWWMKVKGATLGRYEMVRDEMMGGNEGHAIEIAVGFVVLLLAGAGGIDIIRTFLTASKARMS